MDDSRFGFGKNWSKFVKKHFSEERIQLSQTHLLGFLKCESLEGKYFLDIGCGSGLSSLAACRARARKIVSFDYDHKSVEATSILKQYAGNPENWQVKKGSILDPVFLASIEPADIVYAWGVLHHTGDVWRALDNTVKLVNPEGMLYAALYEYNVQVNPPPEFWLEIKQRYNRGGWFVKRKLELWYIWRFMLNKDMRAFPKAWRDIRGYKDRGMEIYTDLKDWLGGWPMEFVKKEDVERWAVDHGLVLRNLKYGEANTEYLFALRK